MPLQIYANPNLGPALLFQGSAMMGQGFAQGISTAGASLADAFARRQEEEKRLLANGKIAEQIMQANPELLQRLNMSPEAFKSMSARDKSSAVQSVITTATIEQALANSAKTRAEVERARRSPAFLDALAQSGQLPGTVPAPVSNETYATMTETDPMRRISAAARQSGFSPTIPETVDLVRGMTDARSANEYDINRLGVPFSVPGRPDLDAIPITTRSIQVSPRPPEEGAALERQMIGGKPSGWFRTPDGHYLRDPSVAAAETGPDPAQFDANGDGVLDQREWAQWMLAAKLGAGAGAYPGMRLNQPKAEPGAPGPAPAGISAEDFKRWKSGRGK